MKGLKSYTLTGTFFVFLIGTLFHFVYQLSGNNFIVGLFTPINESVWEHTKLIFFPMLLYSAYSDKKISPEYPCISSSVTLGALSGILMIISLFYTYSGIIGFNTAVVDISIFYISVIISFYIVYKSALRCKSDNFKILLFVIKIILIFLFIIFTIYPPDIPLFQNPVN